MKVEVSLVGHRRGQRRQRPMRWTQQASWVCRESWAVSGDACNSLPLLLNLSSPSVSLVRFGVTACSDDLADK